MTLVKSEEEPLSGRYLNLYMSEETTRQFEFLKVAWGLTGERQQGQVIAKALASSFTRERERIERKK